ncbi:MAG: hypothetical protein R3C99_00075 [Pirellulaceae bacterium]
MGRGYGRLENVRGMLAKNCCRFWFKFRATTALKFRRVANSAALLVALLGAATLEPSRLTAQNPPDAPAETKAERVDWKVDGKLRQQLQLPADVVWREKPLRDGLMNLAIRQQVAVFLDRRVDPDRHVNFSSQNLSLAQLLTALTAQENLRSDKSGRSFTSARQPPRRSWRRSCNFAKNKFAACRPPCNVAGSTVNQSVGRSWPSRASCSSKPQTAPGFVSST